MLIVTLLNAFVCLWAHACIIAHLSWNGLGDALILKAFLPFEKLMSFWKAENVSVVVSPVLVGGARDFDIDF